MAGLVAAVAALSSASRDLSALSATPLAATLVGVNAHTAGGSAARANSSVALIDFLRTEGGFHWVRDDFSWASMEPAAGRYDTSPWDASVARLGERGMGLIAVTSADNPLYDGGRSVTSEEGVGANARWVASLAKKWPRSNIWWEIVNEPNFNDVYGPNSSAYVALVAAVDFAVRADAPIATLAGPACCNLGGESGAWLRSAFDGPGGHGGVLRQLDRVTIHPYRSNEPETFASDFGGIADLVAEYAPVRKVPMPIAVGEWGYGAATLGSLEEQAKVFARQMLLTTALTLQPTIWYQACDPDVSEGQMGVMNCTNGGPPFAPLPAFDAARAMHRVLRNDDLDFAAPVSDDLGYRFVRRLPAFQGGTDTSDDVVLLYRSLSGDVMLACWTSADFGHVVRLPGAAPPGACWRATGMFGEDLGPVCHDARGLHVNVTSAPIYLRRSLGST